jgi:hypothetical protein
MAAVKTGYKSGKRLAAFKIKILGKKDTKTEEINSFKF